MQIGNGIFVHIVDMDDIPFLGGGIVPPCSKEEPPVKRDARTGKHRKGG